MKTCITLTHDHVFLDQLRREHRLQAGLQLTGDLTLAASVWPFGVMENGLPTHLFVQFRYHSGSKPVAYKAVIDSRKLWPRPGSTVWIPDPTFRPTVGPIGGMRDDRDNFTYFLPDRTERRFDLKYVDFAAWIMVRQDQLDVKLRHFCPGTPPDDHPILGHSMPIEAILFRPELKLSYDRDGFPEDCNFAPYVRIDDAVPPPDGPPHGSPPDGFAIR